MKQNKGTCKLILKGEVKRVKGNPLFLRNRGSTKITSKKEETKCKILIKIKVSLKLSMPIPKKGRKKAVYL